MKARNRTYEKITLDQALAMQVKLREEIQNGDTNVRPERQRYGDYANALLQRKIETNQLSSKKSRRVWGDAQKLHLIPAFGDWYLDAIRRVDIEDWKAKQGRKVRKGKYSPHSVNGWLRVLLATLRSAVIDFDLDRDPTRGIQPLDTSTWHTFTEEEPNSLTVDELPRFMAKARMLYPQHFAMLALGVATGRRPCELRPLRRRGDKPDVLWDEGIVLIRRSETFGEAVERTKTKRRLRIPLPGDLVEILRWHVNELAGKMRESDLLFPARTGKFRSPSCLDKPICRIAEAAGIAKHLTPKFMRRTFQDLGRAAQVHDLVVRAISGHATAEMQSHYSSVNGAEVRDGLAKVISLAGFIEAHHAAERADRSSEVAPMVAPGGDPSGDRAPKPPTAG